MIWKLCNLSVFTLSIVIDVFHYIFFDKICFCLIDTDGLICQALLAGNFEAAVDVCFGDQRMADGLLLAIAGGPDLFTKTQKRYLTMTKSPVSKVETFHFYSKMRS